MASIKSAPNKQLGSVGVASLLGMAEKVEEESIAKRLSRKRDSFYKNESKFITVKKKRESNLLQDEVTG